ncbi:MAG: beta-N-acetylhexosaminidase [Armatimonadetes bacterium]|nr:beta-N-acetylhexosaminidase [Armatimonadota bacterium]
MVSLFAAALATVQYPIIPEPVTVIQQPGHFSFNEGTVLVADKGLKKVADMARGYFHLHDGTGKQNAVVLKIDKSLNLNDEGYRLIIDKDTVEISGKSPAGVFYGLQSLRQLVPLEGWKGATSYDVPAVIIEDEPRFKWRGAMLDTGRNFMPKEFIKKFIDTLALHKMNSFHWHLTEDQGWRLEIKKYPKLTSVGSKRAKTMLRYSPAEYDETPYGGFYTQEDAKEIVKYAADRFVNVVPEIEMPGHSQAAIAAYPELGNTGEQLPVATTWGVIKHVYNPEEKTIQFLKDVLDEVMAIFPSKFIHIGGDECPKDEWKASPRVQELIKERGLKDEHEMQSWFVKQIDQYLASKGRRLIGWDEILEGGLAPGATVMSWRGEKGGIEAAASGHDVVMASNGALYFDYYQADPKTEPHAIGGFLPLRKVYDFDLVPAAVPEANRKHILGGQFQLWTEYIRTPEYAEYMAFPRGLAAAEIFWTPKNRKNFRDFVDRLRVDLTKLNINARPLDANLGLPTAEWKAGQVSNDYQTKTWDITSGVSGDGSYTIRFQYTSGAFRLDVDGIEILANGKVVGSDSHYGRTGSEDVDNVWKVKLTGVPVGAKIEIRAKVRADGGSDSNGDIVVTKG